jgi:hypothetical protein
VPVTAKLSRRFYEQFGDELTDELVNLFNNVDANSRSELRELNTQNFALFDAKMQQRFAESDAKWEKRFAESDVKWEKRITELGSALRVEMHALRSDVIKWMFLFFTGSALVNVLLR